MNLCEKGIIHVLLVDFLIFANSKKMEVLGNPRLYPNLFWKIKFALRRGFACLCVGMPICTHVHKTPSLSTYILIKNYFIKN